MCNPESSHTVLSAFSGVGGLDLGLEAAGFKSVGAIEWDPDARRSLKANRGDRWPLVEPGDIELVASGLHPPDVGLEVGELTLLAGAPPCQPFSKAAQWSPTGTRGLEDPRASYLSSFLTLVERFRPEFAILENVIGFVKGKNSVIPLLTSWLDTVNRLKGRPYKVEWNVLDAADFGVPQKRRRAIVVIHHSERPFSWPEAKFSDTPMTAWDALHSLPPQTDVPQLVGKWSDLLPTIPEGANYQWHTRVGGGVSLFGYRTRYWSFLLKLAKDLPSWTIPAQPGPSAGPFHWDNRPLSVKELLRLQTLPDTWVVEGARREQVRQVGNATPALLAEVLGRSIRCTLGEDGMGSLQFLPKRATRTPGPTATADLPDVYSSMIADRPDHPGTGQGPGRAG